jgi:ABC-2 type transport system permease protein
MSFVVMPMFFLSGALFPLTTAPDWLRWISYINPLTYGVDILRWAAFGGWETLVPVAVEIIILILFVVLMMLVCSRTFTIKK